MYTPDGFDQGEVNMMQPMLGEGQIKPDPDGEVPVKIPKKRGPKKKKIKQEEITDHMPVKKRKRDRFNGMTEDEVMKRELPDHLEENLDIVIIGINPGLCAAYVGHHYAGPGNHFWKCMFLSGLIPEQLNAYDDYKLTKYGIGFTNIVARTTRGSADLTRKEIKEGAILLLEKMKKYKPKIAVFNGKGIYEVFVGHKNFAIGKQPEKLEGTDTAVFVMPSSSARCSQLPRAVDKVPFYAALKKLRDYMKGDLETLDDTEVCFPDLELKVVKKEPKMEPTDDVSPYFVHNPQMNNMGHSNGQMEGMPQCNGMYDNNGHFMNIKQENNYNMGEYGRNSCMSNCSKQEMSFSNCSSQPMQMSNCSSQLMPYSFNQNNGQMPQAPQMYDNSSQVVQGADNSHCFQGSNQPQVPYSESDLQMHNHCISQHQPMMNQHSNLMTQGNQGYQGQGHYQGQGQFYPYQQYNQDPSPVQTQQYMSQSYTQAPGYSQAISMQMQSQVHQQGQGSFMMSSQGEFRMSMTTQGSWTGQHNMIKQEPHDWSGCDGGQGQYNGPPQNQGQYNNIQGQIGSPQCQSGSPTSQVTSPLQHLQNLSQGINVDHGHQRPSSQQSSYSSGSPRRSMTPGGTLSPMGSPQNIGSPSYMSGGVNHVKAEPTDYSAETSCPFKGNSDTQV